MQYILQHNHPGDAMSSREEHSDKKGQPSSVIKLGIDLHQVWAVVVAQWDGSMPKAPMKLEPAALVDWCRQKVEQGHRVHAVYEACGFGYGLQRALKGVGVDSLVVSPQKLDEGNTRVKTDGRDALALCQRLSRYVGGNPKELAVVRVPTEEEEQQRVAHRQREQLIEARRQLEAQGRSLLVHFGHIPDRVWWKPRMWKSLEVAPWLRERLEVFRAAIVSLQEQIEKLTEELEAAASGTPSKGMGGMSVVIIDREVCDWNRFKNRRQISSYTGLCPSEYSSGGKRIQGPVTKHGNPRLRMLLVEMAWRLVRFCPQYPPIARRALILTAKGRATGGARKKAIVAVARNLAVDLWRLRTGRATPAQIGLSL